MATEAFGGGGAMLLLEEEGREGALGVCCPLRHCRGERASITCGLGLGAITPAKDSASFRGTIPGGFGTGVEVSLLITSSLVAFELLYSVGCGPSRGNQHPSQLSAMFQLKRPQGRHNHSRGSSGCCAVCASILCAFAGGGPNPLMFKIESDRIRIGEED